MVWLIDGRVANVVSVSFAAEVLVKTTLLLGVVLVIGTLMRRCSPGLRSHVDRCGIGLALLLPLACLMTPPTWLCALPGLQAGAFERTPIQNASSPAGTSVQSLSGQDASGLSVQTEEFIAVSVRSTAWTTHWIDWMTYGLIALWITGSSLYVIRGICAVIGTRRLRSASTPVSDPEWEKAAFRASRQLGMQRRIELRQSHGWSTPITVGYVRPFILLPSPLDSWTKPDRSAVLLHELAHIQRHDVLTRWLLQSLTSLYWFHPLVRVLGNRWCQACEEACDDAVLRTGTRADEYAASLIDIALRMTDGHHASVGLAMANSAGLEGRVRRLLSLERPSAKLSSTARLASLAVACFTMMLVAGGSLAAPTPEPPTPVQDKPIPGLTEEVDGRRVTVKDSSGGLAELLAEHYSRGPQQSHFSTDGLLPKQIHPLPKDGMDLVTLIDQLADADAKARGRFAVVTRRPSSMQVVLIQRARTDSNANLQIRPGDHITLIESKPRRETTRRISILGQITSGGPPKALDPPSDAEILAALMKIKTAYDEPDLSIEKTDYRLIKEKIADYIDPPRFYPLIGPANLHHAHYKITLYGVKDSDSETQPKTRAEVFYIDHNHFHMRDQSE
ncbi:MAG: M56 family metallopeptidase [Planctomycetota bacterium]